MLKLYKYLKPYIFMVAAVLFLIFLQTLGELYLPTLMGDMINFGVMAGDTQKIFAIGKIMLLVAALSGAASILASYFSARIALGLGTILRNQMFQKVTSFSLYEFNHLGTSTLITRTTNDIIQIQMVTIMIMRMMISAPMMAIGGIILALQKDRELTWVLAVAIPILALVIFLIASKMIPLFKLVQGKIDRINLVLREKLTGIRVIRAFNTADYEVQRFDAANVDLTNNYIKVNKIMAFMMPSIMLVMNITSIAVLWFGGLRISQGHMDLGALTAFTQYAMQIMFSLLMMAMMFIMVPRAQAAATRINEVLNTIPGIIDLEQTGELAVQRGYVEFKNVTFSYPGAEKPALKDISFKTGPGEVTAIIGGTGSGKSTLLNLILRFFDVEKGRVLVNGQDVRQITQESLRSKIGFVPQKTVLFSDSIAENIKFGNESLSMNEIRQAASVAQAIGFIDNLDRGLAHRITQGGTNLSGGQKQRLAIARALARKPEIYVFDDSFSALDYKTDSLLRAALKREIGASTMIMVAQRVGTVLDADRILVLDNGEIVGQGSHQELLNTCTVYQEIVASQLSQEELS